MYTPQRPSRLHLPEEPLMALNTASIQAEAALHHSERSRFSSAPEPRQETAEPRPEHPEARPEANAEAAGVPSN